MAATLPPMKNRPPGPDLQPANTLDYAEAPAKPQNRLVPIKKVLSKQDRDLAIRLQTLREQQPYLTKHETSAYRYSYIHTLYLDMLERGFHESFSELFALTKQQKERREQAGPDSILWNQILLENEHDKLEHLRENLTKAEGASRQGKVADVYEAQFALARFFLSTGDTWLSDHFFESCLRTCLSAPEETRKLSEAHCNMGLAVEQAGDRYRAVRHFEAFYDLAKDQSWENEDGVLLHHIACKHLTRIYTSVAELLEADDMNQCVEYLLKAHSHSKESNDKKLEGEASYRLGQGYEKNKDYEKALYFMKRYYDICELLCDNHGLGLACEAIGRSYERQGKIEECIKFLKMFVDVAEKANIEKDVSRACSDLGAVFNSLSRYQEAAEYFTKAFNISRSLNDKEAISASRVQYGIAIGHKMLSGVSIHIEKQSKSCTKRLIEWKNARTDAFDKPSTPSVTTQPEEKTEEETKEDTEPTEEEENGEETLEENAEEATEPTDNAESSAEAPAEEETDTARES